MSGNRLINYLLLTSIIHAPVSMGCERFTQFKTITSQEFNLKRLLPPCLCQPLPPVPCLLHPPCLPPLATSHSHISLASCIRLACTNHCLLSLASCICLCFGAITSCSLFGCAIKAKAIAMPFASPLRLGHIAAGSLGVHEHYIT